MSNIININGEIQLNTPYIDNKGLQNAELIDWRIATKDEIFAYKNSDEYKQIQNQMIYAQLNNLDIQVGCNRSLREVLIALGQNGYNNIFLDIENQAKVLREQLNQS